MSAPFLLISSYGESRRTAPSQTEQTRESLSTWIGGAKLSKLESTVRYLGIDVDDALEIAEQSEA